MTLTFLVLFLLIERPAITDWLFGFTPAAVEARWRPVLEESIGAVSSSLVGNVAISGVAGTVAGLSAWALGLPFPVVLAVIAGFALTVGTSAAIAMLVVQLVHQQLENYVVYPLVYRRAVELSPFTTIVAARVTDGRGIRPAGRPMRRPHPAPVRPTASR